jgi:hypothetical protein
MKEGEGDVIEAGERFFFEYLKKMLDMVFGGC